ncbi:prepilin-type N-terminal cleavage/methylation domain-containing protein [Enterobacter ludwigii]
MDRQQGFTLIELMVIIISELLFIGHRKT